MKKGLVVEGGGLRGAYSAGALSWLIDHNIEFDYGTSMSISALYLSAYFTKNKDVLFDVSVGVASRTKVGISSLLSEGNLLSIDEMFDKFFKIKNPLDVNKLNKIDKETETGLFRCSDGAMLWLNNKEVTPDLRKMKAGCLIPFYAKREVIDGEGYYDGGIHHMIPIERAMEKGCDKFLVITTKSKEYVRKPLPKALLFLTKLCFGKIPNLYEKFRDRTDIYEHEKSIVNELIEQDKCIHMFPSKESGVTRFGGSYEQLEELFNIGYNDMENNKEAIMKFLED